MVMLVFLAISALVLAGLYVAFQRSPQRGDGADAPARAPAVQAGSPAAVKPPDPPPAAAAQAEPPREVPAVTPRPAADAAAVAKSPQPEGTFRIAIDDAKGGDVMPALGAKQGDAVTIVITTDRAGTLEIHGYGQRVEIAPGAEAKLAFVAKHAGRFPIHLHTRDGAHVELTAFEVQPR
jgi:hypothetical protein